MPELGGRTALVTGTAHGIGSAIVAALVAARRNGARGRQGHRRRHRPRPGHGAVERIGPVDILVNNAGGVVGQVGRPLEDVSDDDWQAVVDANLTSTFVCTRAVVPGMKSAGYGRIVNISSGAGRSVSLTGIQAYASAKAGQIGFTRQTAHELGPFGITVNSIAPGFVLSNPTSDPPVGELRRRRPARNSREHRDAAPRRARGHRERRALLRRRGGVVGDGAGDLD